MAQSIGEYVHIVLEDVGKLYDFILGVQNFNILGIRIVADGEGAIERLGILRDFLLCILEGFCDKVDGLVGSDRVRGYSCDGRVEREELRFVGEAVLEFTE